MFKLKLHDRKGSPLKIGDIVKVSSGREFVAYAEVKYLPEEKVITPFHTFSFHSFEKIDAVPEGAFLSKDEQRYNIWWVPSGEGDEDMNAEKFKDYLMEWRDCEHHLQTRVFSIELA